MAVNRTWDFFIAPSSVMESTDLGPCEKLIYLALCKHTNKQTNTCYPSIALMEKETGFKDRSIRYALGKLVVKGWIKREKRMGTSDLFTLLEHPRPAPHAGESGTTCRRGPAPHADKLDPIELDPNNNSQTASAVSSTPKGVSENNSQSAQIEEIENQYFESYASIFNSEPLYQYPKNRALIKRRLKELSVWQIKKCIRLAARDEWVKSTGFQLATILSASVLGRLKDMRDPWGIPEIVKPEPKPDKVATPEQVHAAVAGFKARIAARELAAHA